MSREFEGLGVQEWVFVGVIGGFGWWIIAWVMVYPILPHHFQRQTVKC